MKNRSVSCEPTSLKSTSLYNAAYLDRFVQGSESNNYPHARLHAAFKSRILSYLRLASMEHVSAQLPSVRNCPEREREKEDKRGENIMKCQQLKWITVQYQSRHSEKESEREYSAVGECARVFA